MRRVPTEGSNVILCGLGNWSSVMPKSPHMWRKDLGFKYRQTVESVHCGPLSLGLGDTCEEVSRWQDAALCSRSPFSQFPERAIKGSLRGGELSRDPWGGGGSYQRTLGEGGGDGCWKWWSYSEHAHRQRPEDFIERESDTIRLVMISYIENVPRDTKSVMALRWSTIWP